MTGNLSPSQAIDKATELYDAAVARLRAALEAFVTKGETPDPAARMRGDFCYPELRLAYDPDGPVPPLSRAFAKLSEAGLYTTTITQPKFFRDYFLEQLEHDPARLLPHPEEQELGGWMARLARRVRTGTMSVNGGMSIAGDIPFGGYKASGVGREQGMQNLDDYLETKSVIMKVK